MADPATQGDLFNLYRDHSDIRREVQVGFADTRYNLGETSSDIRREGAEHTNEIVKEGLKGQSDIRREAAEHTNEIVREGMKGDFETLKAVKDARHDIMVQTDGVADRMVSQIDKQYHSVENRQFELMRDLTDVRATTKATQDAILAKIEAAALAASKDTEIAVLKNTIEGQKNTQYLFEKIGKEGDVTRALINDLKNSDLNRALIERNAEIVEQRHYGHHWRGVYDQSQFQNLSTQLASQLAAVNSQLAETRQGMVNFGTMAGVGQSSTSNNVR